MIIIIAKSKIVQIMINDQCEGLEIEFFLNGTLNVRKRKYKTKRPLIIAEQRRSIAVLTHPNTRSTLYAHDSSFKIEQYSRIAKVIYQAVIHAAETIKDFIQSPNRNLSA